jgi:nicotinate-nucleotide pyrophosphorylase (carboxylating)
LKKSKLTFISEFYFMTEDDYIALALKEDIGDGDHSSLSTIPADAQGKAKLFIKEDGVLAGLDIARKVFFQVDPGLQMQTYLQDGSRIRKGDAAFIVWGSSRSLLTAERTVLNFLQRMSGIATRTRAYVDALEGLKTVILDTRKTTPNMRLFEKYAVRAGGAQNHRMGLYDMIMIKDNHVDFAGGIPQAIEAVHTYLNQTGKQLRIEIEVRNMNELLQVLKVGKVHRIMLDNYTPALLKEAVEIIDGVYETEASGGITLESIRGFAETGVDYISVGALTHQIKSLDMSLKAIQ